MALAGTLAYEFQVSLPLLSRGSLHGGASIYGFLTAVMGIGAVPGGLIVAVLARSGLLLRTVAAAGFGIAMLAAALVPSLSGELAAMAVVGLFSTGFMATGNTTLQLTAARQFRGRVMALWSVTFSGSTPIGGPTVGAVADGLDPRFGLGLGALACLAATIVGAAALSRMPPAERHAAGHTNSTGTLTNRQTRAAADQVSGWTAHARSPSSASASTEWSRWSTVRHGLGPENRRLDAADDAVQLFQGLLELGGHQTVGLGGCGLHGQRDVEEAAHELVGDGGPGRDFCGRMTWVCLVVRRSACAGRPHQAALPSAQRISCMLHSRYSERLTVVRGEEGGCQGPGQQEETMLIRRLVPASAAPLLLRDVRPARGRL